MYATINLPGSAHFEYHGPDTKAHCEAWLTARVAVLQRTEMVSSLLPQRLVPNREAEAWRYRDGTRVIPYPELHDTEPCCGVPNGHAHCVGCPR